MSNAFDAANYPEGIPERLVVGDRWTWKRSDLGTDYPPASYGLHYRLQREGEQPKAISATATASGTDFLIEIAASTTTAYLAGTYRWEAWIVSASDADKRLRVGYGTVVVDPDPAESTADRRSWARQMLEAVEAALLGRASQTQLSYSIQTGDGSRAITSMGHKELMDARARLRHELRAELASDRARAGKESGRVLHTRFVA